jgi:hypothetical protein
MDVKNLVTKLSVSVAFILLACSLAIGQSETFQAVEPERIPGILRTISNQSKQNFERIHTWQGELEASRYFIDKGEQAKETFETLTDAVGPSPNEIAELTSSRIIFRCDLDKGLFYSRVCREEPSRYFDAVDGRDLGTKSITDWSRYIVTGEYRFSSTPSVWMKGEVIQRKAIKQKVKKDDLLYDAPYVVHQPAYLPRYLFDLQFPAWERYSYLAGIIEEKGEHVVDGLTLRVEQRTLSGDVQYRIHEPFRMNVFDINNIWQVKIFSANASYNMISWEMTSADGKLMHKKGLEYQKVNGVYVPIRDTEDTFDYRDFSLRHHEEGVFKNVRINEPIPAETFTYKNLGLKDGDKFIDKTTGKDFEYKNGELVELAKKPSEK